MRLLKESPHSFIYALGHFKLSVEVLFHLHFVKICFLSRFAHNKVVVLFHKSYFHGENNMPDFIILNIIKYKYNVH